MKSMFHVLCLTVSVVFAVPAWAADPSPNPNIVRWSKGTIEYRRMSTGAVTGSEEWQITVHPDGSRTLNTTNRLEGTQRTVVMRVAPNFRPLDLYAAFWYQGAWVGNGLFTIEGNILKANVTTPYGHIDQQVDIPERFAFIPHPLQSNVWQVWPYDKAKGGAQTTTVYDMQTRLKGPGNVMGPMYDTETTLVGTDDVVTPAGTFKADHFHNSTGTEIYVTGPDAVMVRFVWAASDAEYVLTSLTTGR